MSKSPDNVIDWSLESFAQHWPSFWRYWDEGHALTACCASMPHERVGGCITIRESLVGRMHRPNLLEAFTELSTELSEFRGAGVDRVAFPFDKLAFYRDYVTPNKPCIITGVVQCWPAYTKWQKAYLAKALANAKVTVAVTPNGRADAVTEVSEPASFRTGLAVDTRDAACCLQRVSDPCSRHGFTPEGRTSSQPLRCFALPAEIAMTMQAVLDALSNRSSTAQQPLPEGPTSNVLYLSKQDSSLTAEFQPLLEDIDLELGWACELFGCQPDAVNLWVGGADSVTSFHKDHYENLYAVLSGEKIFTLLPPYDFYRLYLQQLPVARYTFRDEEGKEFDASNAQMDLQLLQDTPAVRWSPVDPNPEDRADAEQQFPLFFDELLPQPLRVQVKKGELLYLPALWHHHVEQAPDEEGKCIAVNWWFDMRFDHDYALLQFAEKIANACV